MQRTAQIHLDGPTGTVLVNGHDISHCVRGLTLTADAGSMPALDLDVVLDEADVDGQALVTIPARTAELLTTLGWTPPAEHEAPPAEPAADASPATVHVTEDRQHFTRLYLNDRVVSHVVHPGLLRGLGSEH